ncbi:MAG: phosphotransferase [Sphingobacteriia bacterium]|nr:phosphotransferase [Sphingobacteriia bacterium]
MLASNMDRAVLKEKFIKKQNLKLTKIENFPQDASFRSYSRLHLDDNKTLVIMDAPPKFEDVRPFVYVSSILNNMGLSAPKVLDKDEENGFLLLEDFGDESFRKFLIKNPIEEEKLYFQAVDVLVEIYRSSITYNLEEYNYDKFLKEALVFAEYGLENFANNKQHLKSLQDEYKEIITDIFNLLPKSAKKILVHRDYHVDNLHYLPERNGIKAVGLIDFQDAVLGSPTYDLMSLIEDARRDVNPEIANKAISRFIKSINVDKDEFMYEYNIWAMQRNLKIVGVFNRKNLRDNNPNYLQFLPRVWGYLKNNLSQSHLAQMKNFFAKYPSK